MAAAGGGEGWKRFGLVKGPGLPALSGQYTVGCVDFMHKLEGDSDGLLVRLFYPTIPLQERAGYQYAKWIPDRRYMKGAFTWRSKRRFPGLLSFVTSLILGELPTVCLLVDDRDRLYGQVCPSFCRSPHTSI